MGDFALQKRIGLLLVAFSLTAVFVGGYAERAAGDRVVRTVKVHVRDVWRNNGEVLSNDIRYLSRSRRCSNHKNLRWDRIRFYVTFDPDQMAYGPEPDAQSQEAGDGSYYLPHSKYFSVWRLGPGHYGWDRSAWLLFKTWNPNGTYAGTYGLNYWWNGLWESDPLNWEGFTYRLRGGRHAKRWTVRFRRKGVLHVLKCVLVKTGRYYAELRPDEDPAGENAPVPGIICKPC